MCSLSDGMKTDRGGKDRKIMARKVWTKPWSLLEGTIIAGGLVMAGLMLELVAGPVNWEAFAWPVNVIILVVFLLLIVLFRLLKGSVYAFHFLCTYRAAVPALGFAVVLTLIMGLTRQTVDGTWIFNMLSFWPFVLIYVYIAFILGLAVARRVSHFHWRRDIPFLFNHVGLFIALTTSTLGNADMQRMKMITTVGETEWRALNQQNKVEELPLAIELKRFIMEEYDDGSPKRFASEVLILTRSGEKIQTVVEVNKPVEVEGWKIYQYGYDMTKGAMSQVSIFELVSDPWLPVVYAGIYMMLFGSLLLLFMANRVRRESSHHSHHHSHHHHHHQQQID